MSACERFDKYTNEMDAIEKGFETIKSNIAAIKNRCPRCGSAEAETEDYLNPCGNAACVLNGPVTYHLGCGSQHKDFCANCGTVLFDSADAEIEAARWEEVKYICSQCEVKGVQPGHFACGVTFRRPA